MSFVFHRVQKVLRTGLCIIPVLILGPGAQTVRAQLGFTVQYRPETDNNDVPDRKLIVLRYGNGMLTPVDTVPLPMSPPFSSDVSISEKFGPGLFVLSMEGGSSFELILNKGKQPVVSGTPDELMDGRARIGRSLENEAYYSLVHLSSIADARSASLREEWSSLRIIDPQYYQKSVRVEEELFRLQRAFNRQLDSLGLLYAHTYTAIELVPTAYFPIPSEQQRAAYETNSAFLYHHFFDALNFSAHRLADNHIFRNRLRHYLTKIVPAEDEYQKQAIDRILKLAKFDPGNFAHVVELLVTYYFIGRRDELVIYTYERYTEDDCSLDQKLQVYEIVTGLNLNRPGDPARELLLPDTSGYMVSLLETALSNRVTILLFWSSHCSVCMDEIPFVMRLYDRYRNQGLAVYAVNLDSQRNHWTEAVGRLASRWADVNESASIKESQVERQYMVRQTPTLFVLDRNGRVLSKNLFGPELESALVMLLDEGGRVD